MSTVNKVASETDDGVGKDHFAKMEAFLEEGSFGAIFRYEPFSTFR